MVIKQPNEKELRATQGRLIKRALCAAFAIILGVIVSMIGYPWWGIGGGIAIFAFACLATKEME